MSFLLDTDIVSAYNKKTMPHKLRSWLVVNDGDSFISILSIAEMRFGLPGVEAEVYEIVSKRVAQTEIMFADALIDLDIDTFIQWKKLLANLKIINRTMTCEDSLLAATAMRHDFTIVTNNVRHFLPAENFGLEIINPLKV